MKLHPAGASGLNSISAYGEGYVMINGQRYESSLIVTPDRVLPWAVQSFDALKEDDFAALMQLGMEIVILGTGPRQRFPHPRLTAALAKGRIGVEVMDVKAACRTYNILVAEERKVAAALLFA
ncbi:MAG: Mth938-like domain-containing protein [Pseudomonadota bacterium]|nr:Mth938-like domain-containing protein [Pseudomonadota bacterium]